MGDTVDLGDATMTVANPRVRKCVLQDNGIWQTLLTGAGQHVVVDVTTGGDVASRYDDLTMYATVGGKALPDGEDVLLVEGEPGAAPRDPTKWHQRRVGFPFPAEHHDNASVRWEHGNTTVDWRLGSAVRRALAREPRFSLRELEATSTADGIELELVVANEGERRGRFVAWVSYRNIKDDSSSVQLDIPVGKTARYRGMPEILRGLDDATVELAYPEGDELARREIAVPSVTTASTTTTETPSS